MQLAGLKLWRSMVSLALIGAAGPTFAQSSIEGTWLAPKSAEITISPCGSQFCGSLSWIVIPKENRADCAADKAKFETEMLDYQNPNPALKSRSLIGLEMMTLTPNGRANQYNVHIYSSEDGKSYDGLAVVTGDTLNLQQCFGVCVTVQSWPRLPTRPGTPGFTCG